MYSVDDTIKALALAPSRHVYSLAIFGKKSVTTWDNDRIYSDTDSLVSAKIDIGSNIGGLTIGTAYSAKLTLKLMGDVAVNQTDRIIMRVGFYNSDGTMSDKIGLGWFYVDTITRKDKLTTVVAYDKMLRGAKNYKPTALTFPCRLSAVLADVCDKMGVTLRDDVTLPYDALINSAPVKGTDSDGNTLYYTRREMLGYIGSLMGGNWFFDAGGHLAFTQFAEVSDTFAAANSTSEDISSDSYTVAGITWNKNGVAYSRFDDEDATGMLEFTNPFDVDAKEPIMGAIEQRLVGLTYHGGTIQRQGCGWFELGDIVAADRKDGTTAPVLITGIGYTISGGAFTEKIYSSALTDSQSNYTSGDVTGQTVPQSVAQDDAGKSSGVGMRSPIDPTSEIFNCYDGKNVAGSSGSNCYATTRGQGCEATGFCAVACGQNCKATGFHDFCGGDNSEANGSGDFVFGYNCIGAGYNSAVLGGDCEANTDYAFVSGSHSTTAHVGAFVHGSYCATDYGSAWSTILGECCTSKGESSLVCGYYLVGSDVTGSAVLGRYNDDTLYNVIFAVGNGNNDRSRSNALTLDRYGNLTIPGTLTCANIVTTDDTAAASLLSDDTAEPPTYTAQSDNVVEFGGVTYTFTAAETGEYTGVTTSTGKTMAANIPAGLGNTQAHNAAFMALAIMSLK